MHWIKVSLAPKLCLLCCMFCVLISNVCYYVMGVLSSSSARSMFTLCIDQVKLNFFDCELFIGQYCIVHQHGSLVLVHMFYRMCQISGRGLKLRWDFATENRTLCWSSFILCNWLLHSSVCHTTSHNAWPCLCMTHSQQSGQINDKTKTIIFSNNFKVVFWSEVNALYFNTDNNLPIFQKFSGVQNVSWHLWNSI